MNTFYKNNIGKRFIINIIYYIGQKKWEINPFDHSIFLISNSSKRKSSIKFSDYKSFVIMENDITEISLSSLINDYFHSGLISNNNNYYSKGINYDSLDLNLFSELSYYYNTLKGFNIDLRYFSSFYLYAKLFQKSSFFYKKFVQIKCRKIIPKY